MENETKQPVSKLEKAALNIRIYASLSFLVVFALIDSVSIALVVSSVKNDDGPVGFSIFILLVFLAFTYVTLMSFLKNNKARNELYKKEAEQNVNQDDFVNIEKLHFEKCRYHAHIRQHIGLNDWFHCNTLGCMK